MSAEENAVKMCHGQEKRNATASCQKLDLSKRKCEVKSLKNKERQCKET